jgi:hypothetical protein
MASEAQVRELVEKMTEERARFIAQVQTLTDQEAAHQPEGKTGEEEWSAKEQLAHLWEMERSYIAWVQRALDEDDPDLAGVRGAPVAIPIERANEHAVAELLAALVEERGHTLRFIGTLTPEQFERRASQPMFGSLTVLQWLRSFYRHDRMHTDQIAGRDPAYKPRFVDGREPDQRRRTRDA